MLTVSALSGLDGVGHRVIVEDILHGREEKKDTSRSNKEDDLNGTIVTSRDCKDRTTEGGKKTKLRLLSCCVEAKEHSRLIAMNDGIMGPMEECIQP
jgi:hypothetical protein